MLRKSGTWIRSLPSNWPCNPHKNASGNGRIFYLFPAKSRPYLRDLTKEGLQTGGAVHVITADTVRNLPAKLFHLKKK